MEIVHGSVSPGNENQTGTEFTEETTQPPQTGTEFTEETTQTPQTGTSDIYSFSSEPIQNPIDKTDQSDDTPDLDELIAEADRQFERFEIGTETETETNIQWEPTKYTRAITKIQKFDTKLRVLSMRDKALKRHTRSMKALLEAGKLQEAEFLALQVPGNEILDEECTDEDGIFHQTELNSKPLHLPPINTQDGPLNLVSLEPSNTMDTPNETEIQVLSNHDISRLEELLEDTDNTEGIIPQGVSSILQEIDSKLELMGAIQVSSEEELVPVANSLDDILSREDIPDRFVSIDSSDKLLRIDTELEILTNNNNTPQDVIETILSEVRDNNPVK